MKMINTEFIEQCNDEIKIETDSLELNEINYLNRIKKRGRPSKAQIINQTLSDNRKINSFSELKLNDTIKFLEIHTIHHLKIINDIQQAASK